MAERQYKKNKQRHVSREYKDGHLRVRQIMYFDGDDASANVVEIRLGDENKVGDCKFENTIFGADMKGFCQATDHFKEAMRRYLFIGTGA